MFNIMSKQRDNLIDILKGLAILAIVQAHTSKILPKSGFPLAEFGMTFCVTSFVFAAGWLFSGISDSGSLYKHIGKRIVKLWWLFFSYSIGMLLISKALIYLGVLDSYYSVGFVETFYNALLLNNDQPLLYPMWFVPMFVLASCFFAAAFCFAQQRKNKNLWHCIFFMCFAFVGAYSYLIGYIAPYYANAAILSVTLMYLGYFAGRNKELAKRCITWWGTVIALCFALFVTFMDGGTIDFSSHYIISPVLFFPLAIAGIYMAMGFAKGLGKLPYISDAVALCGRNSFHIMAMHLLVFKLMDYVWGSVNGISPAVFQRFPVAFDFWYIYVVLGTAICVAVAELGKKILAFSKSVHH